MNNIKTNIERFLNKLEYSVNISGRKSSEVKLVAVTKTVDVEKINMAIESGIKIIGENKVQEFLTKLPQLEECEKHFIGSLQTNKVKQIADKIDLFHSLDRIELLDTLDKNGERLNKKIETLIQINIAKEPTKGGVLPEEIEEFCEKVAEKRWINVKGLMALPKAENKDQSRKYFALVREMLERLEKQNYNNCNFVELSMGMSQDYEQAVAEGATYIRIGSALFGERV